MKKILLSIFDFALMCIYWVAIFLIFKYFWDVYLWGRLEAEQDLMVLKKTEYTIIIPYTYNYTDSKKFIDYTRDEKNNITKTQNLAEKKFEKKYDQNLKKQDKLYDTFLIVKSNERYDVNLSKLWKYDFLSMLETFSTAPYYDTKNETLYVYSHSSWKILNPWASYFNIKEWDTLEFLDYDSQTLDTYEVESRNIVGEKEYNNSIFMTIKDRIVLVTCYPLNSNEKRLYLVLKKK